MAAAELKKRGGNAIRVPLDVAEEDFERAVAIAGRDIMRGQIGGIVDLF
jgi:hypothetical protein